MNQAAIEEARRRAQDYLNRTGIVLTPGGQHNIRPDTWHWFQGGDEGAVVSEFSTRSRDEKDVFRDPAIERVPKSES